ncbi:DEAD/DEAH box helicase [Aliamphritea spongicola]
MTDTLFSSLKLPKPMLDNLADLGYKTMTPIQAQSLPHALDGKDLIAKAKTGSGKTAAFAIGLLLRIKQRDFGTQALILCPTRELSTQVAKELRRLARFQSNLKVVTLAVVSLSARRSAHWPTARTLSLVPLAVFRITCAKVP